MASNVVLNQPVQTVPTEAGSLDSIIEVELCDHSELPHGSMKEVEVKDGHKVLLVNQSGTVSALSNKCTHYGAPLIKGDFCNGVIRCPWHGACFNAVTGDIEEYPGLDSLQKHETIVKNGKIIIRTNLCSLQQNKRIKTPIQSKKTSKKIFVLIGGGPASLTCAENLRQNGFNGKIILVCKEKFLPYDRPKCSKALDSLPNDIALRNAEFYIENRIDIQLDKCASGLNTSKKEIYFVDGAKQKYDKVLLATGSVCRTLSIPGSSLEEIYTLRSIEDANRIFSAAQNKDIAIIGGSFIGMEVASCLSKTAKSVTVIIQGEYPYTVFGEKIGSLLMEMCKSNSIRFVTGTTPIEFESVNGKLVSIKLADYRFVMCQLCIVAIGVTPATEFLKDSKIPIHIDGSLITNPYLEVQPDVYAAGDIATFPNNPFNPFDLVRIEHWQIAHNHGRVVALNMLKQKVAVNTVPFFWTVLFGKSVRFCGYSRGYDRFEFEGSIIANRFVGYYIKEGKVVAVISLDSDPKVSKIANLMKEGTFLSFEKCKQI